VEATLKFVLVNVSGTLPEIPDTVVGEEAMEAVFVLSSAQPYITGTLPQSWNPLKKLRRINFYSRGPTSALPEYQSLTRLNLILIMSHSLTGTLPATWAKLPQRDVFGVSHSVGSGTVLAA
jgi:hypothetical protein